MGSFDCDNPQFDLSEAEIAVVVFDYCSSLSGENENVLRRKFARAWTELAIEKGLGEALAKFNLEGVKRALVPGRESDDFLSILGIQNPSEKAGKLNLEESDSQTYIRTTLFMLCFNTFLLFAIGLYFCFKSKKQNETIIVSNDPQRSCSKEKDTKIRDPNASTISFYEYSNRHVSRGFEEKQGPLNPGHHIEKPETENIKLNPRQSRTCSLEKCIPPKKAEVKKGYDDRHAPSKTDSRTKQKEGHPYAIVVEYNRDQAQCIEEKGKICLDKTSEVKVSTQTDDTR